MQPIAQVKLGRGVGLVTRKLLWNMYLAISKCPPLTVK